MRRFFQANLALACSQEAGPGRGNPRSPAVVSQQVAAAAEGSPARPGEARVVVTVLPSRQDLAGPGRLVAATSAAETAPVLVEVIGTLDTATGQQLLQAIEAHLYHGVRELLLDLAPIAGLYMGGVEAMVHAHQRVVARGGRMVVVAPRPFQREMLRMSCADRVLPVAPDRENGLERLRRMG